ncbi:MAG: copper amine oxidase N-terminal domain-containing protein, partial [Defluviitaleaceae bacterium]|nr:copper amine oxidase N-terminal domain-containing protein [Defluviitaleaceae bacterium]
ATPSPRTTSRVQRQTTSRPAGSTHGTAQQQQQQDTTPRIIGQQATVTISYDGVANLVIATENITAGTYAISILGLPVGIVVPAYADVLNNQLLLVLPGITVDMMGIHYLTITIYNANGEIIATRDGFAFTITDIIPAQELVPVPTQPITPISEGSVSLRFVINSSQYTANGVQMSIADNAAPFIDPIYERTMMPLRAVAESLGATVTWVEETRTVIIVRAGQTITLSIDEALPAGMGMPAIVNGRTFVPLRYVAELLGADVRWDNDARAVYVLM